LWHRFLTTSLAFPQPLQQLATHLSVNLRRDGAVLAVAMVVSNAPLALFSFSFGPQTRCFFNT
jgi:hypothetical protein